MRFIRKNGRVIPIREANDLQERGGSESNPKKGGKGGYVATGALAGGGFVTSKAGLLIAQRGLKESTVARMGGKVSPLFGTKGKLASAVIGAGYGMMAASKVNAAVRVVKTPKGERAGEAAKHIGSAAIGYKIGALASIPLAVAGIKTFAEDMMTMKHGKEVRIRWSQMGEVARRHLKMKTASKIKRIRDVN